MSAPDDVTAPYSADLAYVHDVGFGDFATGAAPGLLAMLAEAGLDGGHVIDLGCGSGQWARALLDRGFAVTGVDIAQAMIERARSRAPEASLHVASAFDFPLPPCDAVTSLGECLGYGDGPHANLRALAALFVRVFEALSAGGLFIFDLATPERADLPAQRHRVEADWTVLVDMEVAPDRQRLSRTVTTFRRTGALWRRSVEVHPQRLYAPEDIVAALSAAGFEVRRLASYGALKLGAGLCGYRARRP